MCYQVIRSLLSGSNCFPASSCCASDPANSSGLNLGHPPAEASRWSLRDGKWILCDNNICGSHSSQLSLTLHGDSPGWGTPPHKTDTAWCTAVVCFCGGGRKCRQLQMHWLKKSYDSFRVCFSQLPLPRLTRGKPDKLLNNLIVTFYSYLLRWQWKYFTPHYNMLIYFLANS